jgi:hypothetical protein
MPSNPSSDKAPLAASLIDVEVGDDDHAYDAKIITKNKKLLQKLNVMQAAAENRVELDR